MRHSARPIRALAVDYAGTLTTSERRRPDGALIRRVLDGFGVTTDEAFEALFGLSLWRYYCQSLPDSLSRLLSDTAERCGVQLPPMDLLVSAIWEACGDHPVDEAGAAVLRAHMDAGRTVLLASNTNRPGRYRRKTLVAAGLGDMLLVCSSDIGVAKPDPAFYARVIAEAAVAPEEILFVGDNILNDVAAPRAAGMQAAHVDRRRHPDLAPEQMADGTLVLSRLSQLPRALGGDW